MLITVIGNLEMNLEYSLQSKGKKPKTGSLEMRNLSKVNSSILIVSVMSSLLILLSKLT